MNNDFEFEILFSAICEPPCEDATMCVAPGACMLIDTQSKYLYCTQALEEYLPEGVTFPKFADMKCFLW